MACSSSRLTPTCLSHEGQESFGQYFSLEIVSSNLLPQKGHLIMSGSESKSSAMVISLMIGVYVEDAALARFRPGFNQAWNSDVSLPLS